MPTLMTVSEIRDAVESGVPDSILETYIEAAEADIERYAGPQGAEVMSGGVSVGRTVNVHRQIEWQRFMYILLPRKIADESSVSITVDETTLSADDFDIQQEGLGIQIFFTRPYFWSTGTRYRGYFYQVNVSYTAVDDTPQRKRALIQLVRLDTQHDGLASESIGGYSRSSANYSKERARILGALKTASSRVA